MKNILINIVVAAISGAVVFAFTMTSVVGEVHSDTKDIEYLHQENAEIKIQQVRDEDIFNQRILAIANNMSEQGKIATDLITLLKIQQNIK